MMNFKVFAQGMLQTNCAVIIKENKCIVVDIPYNARDVWKFVSENKLQVVAVLLTHGHFDHCGGVKQFFEKCQCNAPVYVHGDDVVLCQNAASNRWHVPAENCFPTNFVTEGSFKIDEFQVFVLETSGHTVGSVSYIVDNLLLSGDTLMNLGIGRTDFPESVPSKMAQSLKKLCELKEDFIVIGGHGEITTLNYEKEHNPYLNDIIH